MTRVAHLTAFHTSSVKQELGAPSMATVSSLTWVGEHESNDPEDKRQ